MRFEYVTDKRTFDDGICFDDISIPEIGFFDDAEGGRQHGMPRGSSAPTTVCPRATSSRSSSLETASASGK